jgi:ribosomal protein S18 acetylase RimI-like enzyme
MTEVTALRPVTVDDAPAVLDLLTLCEIAETGEALFTIDEVRSELTDETWRAVAVDRAGDGLAAYAWVTSRPTLRIAIGGIFIRPGGDWSVAPSLVEWLRESADRLGSDLAVHCFASAANPAMCRLYQSVGGTVVRRYYRMGIAVGEGLDPPTRAADVTIRGVMDDGDLRAIHAVVESAFADHYAHEPRSFEEWRRNTVDGACPDLGLWWLATVDGVPASGLYGFAAPAGGYVDTVGTLREFRGRGLGALLLRTAFAEFARRGMPKVSLAVDATNPTGALGLYTSVGMEIEHEDLRYLLPPLTTVVRVN